MFDLELIRKVYLNFANKVDNAKKILNRPMTYAEKILYAHLWNKIEREKILLSSRPIGLLCRTQPPKWLCCNLCLPVFQK